MVSNQVNLNNIATNKLIQQNNVAFKSANKNVTVPVKQEAEEDSFVKTMASNAVFTGIFQGIPFLNFLRNTKKIHGGIKPNAMVEQIAKNNIAAKNTLLKGEGNFIKRFVDYAVKAEKTNDALSYVKSATKAEANSIRLAEKAKKMAEAGKSAEKIAKAEAKAAKAATKVLDKTDDAQKMIKNINQTGKMAAKAGTKIGKVAKFKNFMKSSGLGIQIVFSGLTELMSEVVPTFKEFGVKKGFKQLGKSAVRVLGDVAGYAGFQAVGAYVGSILFAGVPVVGPFLGAALGFGLGMVGSYLAGKVTDKITGPSERELAEKDQQKLAEKNNPFEKVA